MKKIIVIMFVIIYICLNATNNYDTPAQNYRFCSSIFYNIISDNYSNYLYNNEVYIGIGHTFGLGMNKNEDGYTDDNKLFFNKIKINCYIDYQGSKFDMEEINKNPYSVTEISGLDFLNNCRMKSYDEIKISEMQVFERYSKILYFKFDDVTINKGVFIDIRMHDCDNKCFGKRIYYINGVTKNDHFNINIIQSFYTIDSM